jgi:hypothetical protein
MSLMKKGSGTFPQGTVQFNDIAVAEEMYLTPFTHGALNELF